jgi:hypothetical protein
MAKIRYLNVTEALNLDVSGGWSRHASSPATVTTAATSHITITADAGYILLETDQDVYILFSTGATDTIDSTKDLRLIGGTTEFFKIRIPRGLGETVYLHLKAVTATATVKLIEW